jgi:acyl-CoA dehydrogenase
MTAHPAVPMVAAAVAAPGKPRTGSDWLATDCRGMNFFAADAGLRALLPLYMPADLLRHMTPHYECLGELAGGRLDELASIADKHPPVLHARNRYGRDEDWIEYHPAYREMEAIAFEQFGLQAMSHRGGVLGWPEPLPPIAKYTFQYLFTQGEFGLMCPVSVTDTSTFLLIKYADEAVKRRFVPRMLSQDPADMLKGTQFMTEKAGGSDVGAIETIARKEADGWRLYGEKWFCSHADADVAMMLARPEGAPPGTRGLALFALPRRLDDGSRNRYRIVRLKDKLGTRSMASGEIRLEGALAYPVGALDRGLKQMMGQVNLSRLSHGVRAAAMMRRCLNEALQAARSRIAFDRPVVQLPLMRRQLMKLMVPTEQALSMMAFTCAAMGEANRGDSSAERLMRILTPLFKFRACRDNIRVATGAMEARGGMGYIEDFVTARLVRDAHIGVLWEGTSNINALDVVTRAVGKDGAHHALSDALHAKLTQAAGLPAEFRRRLRERVAQAVAFAGDIATHESDEPQARLAASALYHAASAVLLAWEAERIGAVGDGTVGDGTVGGGTGGGDGRRLLLARMVLEHRLSVQDPLAPQRNAWEARAIDLLLDDAPVSWAEAQRLATA